jgi:anti-sigma factor RsiW
MTQDLHTRAEHLLAKERVEGLSDADRSWLSAHLSQCDRCFASAAELDQSLLGMRRVSVEVPSGLARRTQMRVRLRAEELREREPASKILWALTIVSWALGVASAPFVWRGFAWLGAWAGLPKPLWETGVVLWWLVPALVAVGAVLLDRRGPAQEIE